MLSRWTVYLLPQTDGYIKAMESIFVASYGGLFKVHLVSFFLKRMVMLSRWAVYLLPQTDGYIKSTSSYLFPKKKRRKKRYMYGRMKMSLNKTLLISHVKCAY